MTSTTTFTPYKEYIDHPIQLTFPTIEGYIISFVIKSWVTTTTTFAFSMFCINHTIQFTLGTIEGW
eukprot:Pgem_evm1s1278